MAYAFRGIQACVVYLIFSAGWKMLRGLEKSWFSRLIAAAVGGAMLVFSLCAVRFSSIWFILLSGTAGVAVWLVRRAGKAGRQG